MKNLILSLALIASLISCKPKDEAPTPTQPTAPVFKSLYVKCVSRVAYGSTVTVVSSYAFSGSHASDSGYVKQETAPQGKEASIVAFLTPGSTTQVYTYSGNKFVYFTAKFDKITEVDNEVKYNGMAYYKGF